MTRLMGALLVALAAAASAAHADEYSDGWGPRIGSVAPAIEASDQSGTPRDLGSLAGERGLLLVLSRSADW